MGRSEIYQELGMPRERVPRASTQIIAPDHIAKPDKTIKHSPDDQQLLTMNTIAFARNLEVLVHCLNADAENDCRFGCSFAPCNP